MLTSLHIRNLALIETLELPLNQGFIALTGETGAGKSILLDALGLTLGARADTSLVRHGCDKADVQATFDIQALPHIQSWLETQALRDEEEPNTLLLRRVVRATGGSSAWINGIKVPAGQLQYLGEQLVDIHGQHAHQMLLKSAHQRQLLDAFADHNDLLNQTQSAYQRWRHLQKTLAEKRALQADQADQLALIAFKLKDLDALNPSTEQYQALSQQQTQLAHAETLLHDSQRAAEALNGEQGASHQLTLAVKALERIAQIDPQLTALLTQLNELRIGVEEAGRDLHHYAQGIDLDPAQLAQVEEELAEYHRLAKKFMVEPETLAAYHAELKSRHEQLLHMDAHLDALEADMAQAWQAYETAALALRASRQQAAERLKAAVETLIHPLGLPHARFSVQLNEQSADASGMDQVTFMLTTNPGQPPAPLHKVASGGELARISLALEVALAEVAGVPTLIFDEVDVGIGGRVAEQVGRLMRRLGAHRQVLAITHQPQVAACAHHHLKVEKLQQAEQTRTQVIRLSPTARAQELARMLGGATITDTTLKHAQEMLAQGQR